MTERDDLEVRMAGMDLEALQQTDTFGPASPFSCPECGGMLTEFYDGDLLRFRCQIGHAYSPQSLLVNQGDMLDRALDAAVRSLEERAFFADRPAQEARNGKDSRGERRFRQLAQEAEERKEQICRVILAHKRQVDTPEAAADTDSATV